MNIVHILPTDLFGGAEKVVLQLCKNNQHNNICVCCGGDNVKKIFSDNDIKTYTFDINNKKVGINQIRNIVRVNNIQIIHAHDNRASIIAMMCKKKFKLDVKIISHIHNCYGFLKKENMYKCIDRFVRNKYDYNIYCGEEVKSHYRKYGKYIEDRKSRVITNSIQDDFENHGMSKSELGLEGKFVFGFIGRLTKQKGLLEFIEEFKDRKIEFDNCRILIIGDGDLKEDIVSLIEKHNLQKYFLLLGFQENVQKYFNLIDTIIVPSLWEGLPMIILESLVNKKLVVSMDVGSVNEVIINDQTGFLIEKGNYLALINKLIEIKDEKVERDRIENNGRQLVLQKYKIDNQISEINKLYEEVMKGA